METKKKITTTIRISEKTWRRLNRLKKVGEHFEDLIVRMLNAEERK
ncbi:MAG TPA: hypothetical protein VGB37_16440 [Candidatus Lokiarchaeia archaeon]